MPSKMPSNDGLGNIGPPHAQQPIVLIGRSDPSTLGVASSQSKSNPSSSAAPSVGTLFSVKTKNAII